jgi:hypothetical protein
LLVEFNVLKKPEDDKPEDDKDKEEKPEDKNTPADEPDADAEAGEEEEVEVEEPVTAESAIEVGDMLSSKLRNEKLGIEVGSRAMVSELTESEISCEFMIGEKKVSVKFPKAKMAEAVNKVAMKKQKKDKEKAKKEKLAKEKKEKEEKDAKDKEEKEKKDKEAKEKKEKKDAKIKKMKESIKENMSQEEVDKLFDDPTLITVEGPDAAGLYTIKDKESGEVLATTDKVVNVSHAGPDETVCVNCKKTKTKEQKMCKECLDKSIAEFTARCVKVGLKEPVTEEELVAAEKIANEKLSVTKLKKQELIDLKASFEKQLQDPNAKYGEKEIKDIIARIDADLAAGSYLPEGTQPDYTKVPDAAFIQTLTEENKAAFNDELTALRDKAAKEGMSQVDFDKAMETLSAKYSTVAKQ